MSTYRLEIDPTAAEAGAKRVVKSFDEIRQAAENLKTKATGSFSATLRAFKELSNLSGINSKVITDIRGLTATLAAFKGPSGASVKNTKDFLDVLKGLSGFRSPSASGLAAFLNPMAQYKGPSAASAANTKTLLNALSKASIVRVPGSFNSFLTALGAFRGPNANAGKNTVSLLNALANFRPPTGMGGAVKAFESLAASIEKASRAMSNLRAQNGRLNGPGGFGGSGGGGARRLAGDMGFLRESVIRTQTALNALGGVLGVKYLAEASNNIIKIKAQLEAATGSLQQGRVQFQFVREQAEKLGLEFTSVARSYGMLLGSLKGTNITFKETQDLFRGFATGARALQLSTSDVDGVFRALGQILSKGKLQAEELRGQLGDRLPGAFVRFARALDLTKPGELDDALKKGAISGDRLKKALLEVARTMEQEFAVSADKASKTVDSAFNRLKNTFTFTAADFGDNGFNAALISLADGLTKFLKSDALNIALKGVAVVLKALGDNIDLVASIASGVAVAAFASWAATAFSLGKALVVLPAIINAIGVAVAALATKQLAASAATAGSVLKMINPYVLLAVAVAGLIYWYSQLDSEARKTSKALIELGDTDADMKNFFEAMVARTGDLKEGYSKLKEEIFKTVAAQDLIMQRSFLAPDPTIKKRGKDYNPQDTALMRGTFSFFGGDVNDGMTPQEQSLVAPLGNMTSGGFMGKKVSSAADYRAALLAINAIDNHVAVLKGFGQNPSAELESARNKTVGYLTRFENPLAKQPFDALAIKKEIYGKVDPKSKGDYNRANQEAGISGDVPDKDAAREAAAAAKQDTADIQRAVNSFTDLRKAAEGSRAVVRAALRDSSTLIVDQESAAYAARSTLLEGVSELTAAQARATAASKVKDVEDSFGSAERASAGLVAVAKALDLQAGSAKEAKQSLLQFYAVEKATEISSQNAAKVAGNIKELEIENNVRKDNMEAIIRGGRALEDSNVEKKVQSQLIDIEISQRKELEPALRAQLKAQENLNRAEEAAAEINKIRTESKSIEKTAQLYSAGLRPADLENAKELNSYMQPKIERFGADSGIVQYFMALKLATQAQEDALKRVGDQYEAVRQLSVDQADAIVGSIRDLFSSGEDSAKSFGGRIKDLFKNLGDIVMNFVLYNPLRNYLSDVLTGQNSKQYVTTGGAPAVDTGGAFDAISSIFSSTSSAIGSSGSVDTSFAASVMSSGNPAVQAQTNSKVGAAIGSSAADAIGEIFVNGERAKAADPKRTSSADFSAIQKVFDSKTNGKSLKEGINNIGEAVKGITSGSKGSGGKNMSANLDKLGDGISKVAATAGTAFAAYQLGSSAAKALGLGQGGQKIAGGAAAGFAIGGPVGAAIGAVAGGVLALFSQPKKKTSYSEVVVGSNGNAGSGLSGQKNGGDEAAAQQLSSAGADAFNSIATNLDAYLKAGNYGSFGTAPFKGDGTNNDNFYSLTGKTDRDGIPIGRKGVDYFNGTADQVALFAIREQLKTDKFAGADPIYRQIAQNSKASSTSSFSTDLQTGKDYLAFVESARIQNEVAKSIAALNKSYEALARQSKALGLNEGLLLVARDKLLKSFREEFDTDIGNKILTFTDPLLASYNSLIKEYKDSVSSAVAVGGDLAQVEKLYGLKRTQIAEEYQARITNGVQKSAADLLTSLTSGSASPLARETVFGNAQTDFRRLSSELKSGNFTNAADLQNVSQNYLDSAKGSFRSSTDYFSVFDEVTGLLSTVSDSGFGAGATNAANLPELPGVQAIVDELARQNDDLVEASKNVGMAVIEGNEGIISELVNIRNILGAGQSSSGGASYGAAVGAGLYDLDKFMSYKIK